MSEITAHKYRMLPKEDADCICVESSGCPAQLFYKGETLLPLHESKRMLKE